jgi:hypothetical protein
MPLLGEKEQLTMIDMTGLSFRTTKFSFQLTNRITIGYFLSSQLQITVIDSLYEPRQCHVTILENMVRFIHEYGKSKDLLQDKWA